MKDELLFKYTIGIRSRCDRDWRLCRERAGQSADGSDTTVANQGFKKTEGKGPLMGKKIHSVLEFRAAEATYLALSRKEM